MMCYYTSYLYTTSTVPSTLSSRHFLPVVESTSSSLSTQMQYGSDWQLPSYQTPTPRKNPSHSSQSYRQYTHASCPRTQNYPPNYNPLRKLHYTLQTCASIS